MKIHDAAFYGASSFLIGVFVSSFVSMRFFAPTASLIAGAIFVLSLVLRRTFFAHIGAIFFIFSLGGGIYFMRAESGIAAFRNSVPPRNIIVSGRIVGDPERGSVQKAVVLPDGRGMRKILVTLPAYPALAHGDTLTLSGKIEITAQKRFANYLAARGIGGTMYFPEVRAHQEGGRSPYRAIFKIKRAVIAAFSRALPAEHAALLSGITLGEREGFSKSFKDAMAQSGTSHIAALSGYNIAVVSAAMLFALSFFVRRRTALIFSLSAIVVFVIMTGAEPSVVRAAIMGSILMLSQYAGRTYRARNAIALTAFFMTLYNPYMPAFDAGFQLSFAALIGMIYIAPFLLRGEAGGILGVMRTGAAHTVAAQVAVFPILAMSFGTVSLTSVLANALIVGVIPITMLFGFVLGISGIFGVFFSSLVGWVASVFLAYEIAIINFFSNAALPLPHIGAYGAVFYYALLAALVAYAHKRNA